MTPEEQEIQLSAVTTNVREAIAGRTFETPADLAAIVLATTLHGALEAAVPDEVIETIFAQVIQLNNAAKAAASGPEQQLEAWFDACLTDITERIPQTGASTRELFATVYNFAAGAALGTGTTIDEAVEILKYCEDQLAKRSASAKAPPALASQPSARRYTAPTS